MNQTEMDQSEMSFGWQSNTKQSETSQNYVPHHCNVQKFPSHAQRHVQNNQIMFD